MQQVKVELLKPLLVHGCNYPAGSIVMLDERLFTYLEGMRDVKHCTDPDAKITPFEQYTMAPRDEHGMPIRDIVRATITAHAEIVKAEAEKSKAEAAKTITGGSSGLSKAVS